VTDPAVVAAVAARAMARHAHHEAGHAVAAVAAGGQLVDVFLGVVDWSTCDDGADTAGGTVHCTAWEHQPFVTFAGPWAEATWVVQNDPEVSDFDDALAYAWDDNSDGDTAKYEGRVDTLTDVARQLGFGSVGRAWELEWSEERESLWPAVCEIAALLIDYQPVIHATVLAAINRCRELAGGAS
jgi:hypothetical protein